MKRQRQSKWRDSVLPLAMLGGLLCVALFPFVAAVNDVAEGGDVSAQALRNELVDPSLLQALLRTLTVAFLACAGASIVAIPLASHVARAGSTTRTLVQVFGLLPLAMPPYLTAAVLHHFVTGELPTARPGGAMTETLYGSIYLVAAFALHFLPLLTFTLTIGIQRIDRSMLASARNLGAGRIRTWRRIVLPLATPAYLLGVSIAVLRIIDDVGTPLLLGVDGMLAPRLFAGTGDGALPDARLAAVVLALFGLTAVITILSWSLLATPVRAPDPRPHQAGWRARSGSRMFRSFVAVAGTATLALLPLLWLVAMALDNGASTALQPQDFGLAHYRVLLDDGSGTLRRTLLFAAATGLLSALLGGAIALLWKRPTAAAYGMRFTLIAMFALPGVILALAYQLLPVSLVAGPFVQSSWPWLAAALVVTLKLLPLVMRITATHRGRRTVPDDIAAQMRSLSGTGTYLRLRAKALGGIFGALFVAGTIASAAELSIPLILFGQTDALLALDMFTLLQNPSTRGQAAAEGTLLVGLQFVGLLLIYLWAHPNRRLPRGARTIPQQPAARGRDA